jgi:hypothetical protein
MFNSLLVDNGNVLWGVKLQVVYTRSCSVGFYHIYYNNYAKVLNPEVSIYMKWISVTIKWLFAGDH